MGINISRVLIEITVRKALRDIQRSPERGIRNLVDMGLNFSDGRFQREFFEIAQGMLRNENSAYYSLVKDTVAHVDRDTITAFGMNVGYNSFTRGAERIRRIEAERHFDIPWALSAQVDMAQYPGRREHYASLVRQGKALGIFTYLFFLQGCPDELFALISANQDCAFVLFCSAEELTPACLTAAKDLHNLMFALRQTPKQQEVCRRLRQDKLLYAVCVDCTPQNLQWVLDGSALKQAEQAHPVFTLFLTAEDCDAQMGAEVYAYICRTRKAQEHPTFLMDIRQDMIFIDGIISDNACSVCFDADGTVCVPRGGSDAAMHNLFQHRLEDILKALFPKPISKESEP